MAGLACVVIPVGVGLVVVGAADICEGDLVEDKVLEVRWSVLPAALLIGLGVPSLKLLYLMEEGTEWGITVSGVGFQWYWEYFYPDFLERGVERFCLIRGSEMRRVLDVDTRALVPVGTPLRVLVTGGDVIHRWAMPRLGVKVDAIPGRINSAIVVREGVGVIYGQCSEICGANHRFIPIVLEVVPLR